MCIKFLVYLIGFSIIQNVCHQVIGGLVNNEFERVWKEVIVV
jgi:hypothetical protein